MNSEVLFKQVKHAYEISRLENALWTLIFIAPLFFCSIFICHSVVLTLVFGVLLGGILIYAKWRGQQIGRAVFPGLVIGWLAYLIPFVWMHINPDASSEANLVVATGAGVVAGVALLLYCKTRGLLDPWFMFTATAVVALSGCLACPMLGVQAIAGMAAGVVAVSGLALAWRSKTSV